MSAKHSPELENWVYHHLMEKYFDELNVCVYVD